MPQQDKPCRFRRRAHGPRGPARVHAGNELFPGHGKAKAHPRTTKQLGQAVQQHQFAAVPRRFRGQFGVMVNKRRLFRQKAPVTAVKQKYTPPRSFQQRGKIADCPCTGIIRAARDHRIRAAAGHTFQGGGVRQEKIFLRAGNALPRNAESRAGPRVLDEQRPEKENAPHAGQGRKRRPNQFGSAVARNNHVRIHAFARSQHHAQAFIPGVGITQQRGTGKPRRFSYQTFGQRRGGEKTVGAEIVNTRFSPAAQPGRRRDTSAVSGISFQRLIFRHIISPRQTFPAKNIRQRLELAPNFRQTRIFPYVMSNRTSHVFARNRFTQGQAPASGVNAAGFAALTLAGRRYV